MKYLVAALLLSWSLQAGQDVFLGTWKLMPAKCRMSAGAPPPPEGVTVTYASEGAAIKVTATMPGPDGTKRTTVHTETYDGQPHDRYEGKPNGETLTHRRIDERTEETTWRKNGEVQIVTTRTVSADGKTMTSVVKLPGKAEVEAVMVYERE